MGTSAKVKNRYNKKAYDFITITVKKGRKEVIKSYAQNKGKSVNSLINEMIDKEIDPQQAP